MKIDYFAVFINMSHFAICRSDHLDKDDAAYCDRALKRAIRECKKISGGKADCYFNVYKMAAAGLNNAKH